MVFDFTFEKDLRAAPIGDAERLPTLGKPARVGHPKKENC